MAPASALPRIYRVGQCKALRSRSQEVSLGCEAAGAAIDALRRYLEATRCLGVAAPQLNAPVRVFGMRSTADVERMMAGQDPEEEPWVCVNPSIEASAGMTRAFEGCLSIPGAMGPVFRPESMEVSFTEPCGAVVRRTVSHIAARVFAHELDHLDGVLFTDRVGDPESMVPMERFKGQSLLL